MDQRPGMLWNKIVLEQPTVSVSGESRYLSRLWVSGNLEPRDGTYQSDPSSSQSIIAANVFKLQTESLISDHQVSTVHKISATLKCLSFREPHVLVQFWSPRQVGKHQLLTTNDQPFGVGAATEELYIYRKDSERNYFLVNKDHEEEDLGPPARVFRQGMPEWTSDLSNYNTKHFPQLDFAIRCNFHGYLALPVFDSTTGLCVGVLELLTSVKYTSYAVEVQQVHKALKAEHLLSPKAFNFPDPKVLCERRRTELDKIKNILKNVCGIHSLPLAQTWTVSPCSSFVSNNKVIEKTCSSFDTRCIGKVCMSTTSLPYYVGDMCMWNFMKACRKLHLDKYSSSVGEALLSRGSSYVQNVTELSENEYPLVHYARMSGLTSCFTVFLHSVQGDNDDDDYVLEFFLQLNNDSRFALNLVQTLKQNVEFASGFELGEIPLEEFTELNLALSEKPHAVQISPTTTANTRSDSSDSDPDLANGAKKDSAIVPSQSSSKQNQPNDGKTKNRLKKSRKHNKTDSLTMEAVKNHIGKPLDQTAQIFGVSRSTMKRFCRKHGISSWPLVPKQIKRSGYVFDPKLLQNLLSEKYLQRSSSPSFGSTISVVFYVMLKVKRWSCLSKKHGFSGKWWNCGKHSYLPFHGSSLTDASSSKRVGHGSDTGPLMVKESFNDDMVKQNVEFASGFELGEISPLEFTSTSTSSSSSSTNSSDSTSSTRTNTSTDSTTSTGRKRAISSWSPESNQMKRSRSVFDSNGSAISHVVYLLLKVKRWSCSIKKHGFSGKWWSCGKHCCLPFHGSCFIDAGSLTVKASFKDDIVKFRFLVSSGFVELENEVVKRMENLKGKRFRLKYEDEDKDMVLIDCDADLKFLTSNTTIKLVVEVVD